MSSVTYRALCPDDITRSLFAHFVRRQVVTDCWRWTGSGWAIRPDPFIDDWDEADYAVLLDCLHHTLQTGGAVFGAFLDNTCKGFASVEATPLGSNGIYRDLTSLHVSEDARRQGIGKTLLHMAAAWAKQNGAQKLYISSHSAAETQAFYRGLGCTDAAEINEEHVRREPFDCQLEYTV